MKRNFPDFLKAYLEYADNKFAPRAFHYWSGASIIAGALERKVWLPWSVSHSHFPNLFIFLVSNPGSGKSSALMKAVELMHEANGPDMGLNILPTQMTEAKFIDLMSIGKPITIGTKTVYHSSGYYAASEASHSLKNIFGDFIAATTAFYDCPAVWKKGTVGNGVIELHNVCFNMIAGCTFEYLGKLITDDNIMGGFASRVTYVISRDPVQREARFQDDQDPDAPELVDFRRRLVHDLQQINKLHGKFTAEASFKERYLEWFPLHQDMQNAISSEKMKSLMVRKEPALLKLCMILSASESNDLVLKASHWDEALTMIDAVEKDMPNMLRESEARQTGSQSGLNQAIMRYFVMNGGIGFEVQQQGLTAALVLSGYSPDKAAETIMALVKSDVISVYMLHGKPLLKLLVDPNAYL